jgi:hypothetical protein
LIFFFHFLQAGGRWHQPSLLDVCGTVSEEAVRLGMRRIEEKAGLDWLSTQILGWISPALGWPWILNIDVIVKPLHGRQEGAAIGYTLQKPGRPSQHSE